VVLVELVVLVLVVEVLVVVVDEVDVVAGSVDDGGTNVPAVLVEEEGPMVVTTEPSADWMCSLHAATDSTTITSAPGVARFIPRSRPTARRRGGTSRLDRAPSTRRDGR
jgi:hypothetical protein